MGEDRDSRERSLGMKRKKGFILTALFYYFPLRSFKWQTGQVKFRQQCELLPSQWDMQVFITLEARSLGSYGDQKGSVIGWHTVGSFTCVSSFSHDRVKNLDRAWLLAIVQDGGDPEKQGFIAGIFLWPQYTHDWWPKGYILNTHIPLYFSFTLIKGRIRQYIQNLKLWPSLYYLYIIKFQAWKIIITGYINGFPLSE